MSPAAGGMVPPNENHFVKLPYTPLQAPAAPPLQAEGLEKVPVVVLPLHSHLAPACCKAAALRPDLRVSFVWQEGGALPVAFSGSVRRLRDLDLLHTVVSSGNCSGGDVEAPNIYAGLLAAAAVSDLILVGIGPGVVGYRGAVRTRGHVGGNRLERGLCPGRGAGTRAPHLRRRSQIPAPGGFAPHPVGPPGRAGQRPGRATGIGRRGFCRRSFCPAPLHPGFFRGRWIRGAVRGNLREHGKDLFG